MKKTLLILISLILMISLCACSLIGNVGNNGGKPSQSPSDVTPPISSDPENPITPDDNPSTEPDTPVIPSDPIEPSNPVNPSDPVEPSNPVNPSDPINPSDPVEPSDPIEPSNEPIDPDFSDTPVTANEELQIYNALFNHENKIKIRLDISDKEFAKLQKDYEKYQSMGSKSPIYRMADLYVTIISNESEREYKVAQVGVRMKGNTSRTNFWNENDGMYNLVHLKLDFGETFDDEDYYGSDSILWENSAERKERKDRTFATLEKLDLKWNRNFDATNIKEGYMYDFYRECGVIAPQTNLASVDIASDHAGVWRIYEPIDKIFLEKNLPEEAIGGDLYKLGWTNEGATFTSFSQYGVEDEDSCKFFIYDLKTNKKKSDHSSLKALIEGLNSSELTKESFNNLVDTDNFLAYCAVSYIIGNPDDLRNNYNNTYIYFRKDTGKLVIIPYDMDRGFGINIWNPYGNSMTNDSPLSSKTINGNQRNPLFYKSILEDGFLVNEYLAKIEEVMKNEMLSCDNFEKEYNVAKALYEEDIKPSKNYQNANKDSFVFDIYATCEANQSRNMSFADYITAKLNYLNKYFTEGESAQPIIRGDFTDWNINDNYLLEKGDDGIYSISISVEQSIKFKIYNKENDKWYGADSIDEQCTVNYESIGENKNIGLGEGKYIITFNAKTKVINIEIQ